MRPRPVLPAETHQWETVPPRRKKIGFRGCAFFGAQVLTFPYQSLVELEIRYSLWVGSGDRR